MADHPALELSGLTKRFGDKLAVDDIDLSIPVGSFFGVVGRNGAGKTTAMKMCTGLLRPTSGTARIEGVDMWTDPVTAKAIIGVLPETMALFDRLTGAELLLYNGMLRGIPRDTVVARSTELLGVLGLDDAADRLVIDYSHGMTKKVALAAALLHGPRVLFLDEPFEAIDPVSTRTIEEVLGQHVAAGGTVVFSSHVLDVVERLCDLVAVIELGQIKTTGPVDEVRDGKRLEDAFIDLVGTGAASENLTWLGDSSA